MKLFALLGQPGFLKGFHGWCIVGWAATWGVAHPLGWINSIAFISEVTMATALLTSFAAWCAARVEVKQDEQNGDNG